MKRSTLTALAAAIGLAFGASALANTMMSKADYSAGKKAIAADYKSAKADCDPLVANAKDVCVAEARGREKVALAELEARNEPSDKHRHEVRIAQADAAYAIAKEKCDDRAGNDKDVCMKEAASVHTAAVADAKTRLKTVDANKTAVAKTQKADAHANKEIAAARHDAADDKRDAQYAVAKEKCDALSGDAKDVCVKDAKARYGKS